MAKAAARRRAHGYQPSFSVSGATLPPWTEFELSSSTGSMFEPGKLHAKDAVVIHPLDGLNFSE